MNELSLVRNDEGLKEYLKKMNEFNYWKLFFSIPASRGKSRHLSFNFVFKETQI